MKAHLAIYGILLFIMQWCRTSPVFADPTLLLSKQYEGAVHKYSSPAVASLLQGNNQNQIVFVVGAVVYAVTSTGEVLWTRDLPNKSCASSTASNKVYASPAVADLKGDGRMSVVAAYGGFGGTACGGGVIALDGETGNVQWHYDLKVAAKRLKFFANVHSVFSSPSVVDLDGDGKREVVFGSWDRNIYVLNNDGSLRWYYQAADTVWSSPAIANIDSSKAKEIIIGTDISKNARLKPQTFNGGYVYAFKAKQPRKVMTFRAKEAYHWQTYFEQVVYASPTVGELIAANPGPEVVIASGCFFPQNNTDKSGKWLKVLSARTGKVLRTLDLASCSTSQAAIADLNADGVSEVVFPANSGQNTQSLLYAWTPSSNTLLWTQAPSPQGRAPSNFGEFTSPVIADLDGNGSLEVVVNAGAGFSIYSGNDGTALSCMTRGCTDSLPSFDLGSDYKTTPVVADLDGDGTLELVMLTGSSGSGVRLKIWSNFTGLGSPTTSLIPYSVPWGQIRKNAEHSGSAVP